MRDYQRAFLLAWCQNILFLLHNAAEVRGEAFFLSADMFTSDLVFVCLSGASTLMSLVASQWA